MLKHRFIVWMFSLGMILVAGVVSGQDFPNKPIRFFTTTPGGANDLVARLVGSGLASNVGWSVLVENRPTALIAAETVAKAPPDGYTLLVSTDNLWIGPFLQKVPYDPIRDGDGGQLAAGVCGRDTI